MQFSAAALFATIIALAGGVSAQLSILAPGGSNLWMIAESDNVFSWTCKTSPYASFAAFIVNSDVNVLASLQVYIAQLNNFDCSKLIPKDRMILKPATGYSIQLADPLNTTHIYAQSEPFEIKPFGFAYPASSATPTGASSSTSAPASRSAASTSTRASASSTPTGTGTAQGRNGAAGLFAPTAAGVAGLAAAAAALAALGFMFA